jgi:hypothetical protein
MDFKMSKEADHLKKLLTKISAYIWLVTSTLLLISSLIGITLVILRSSATFYDIFLIIMPILVLMILMLLAIKSSLKIIKDNDSEKVTTGIASSFIMGIIFIYSSFNLESQIFSLFIGIILLQSSIVIFLCRKKK